MRKELRRVARLAVAYVVIRGGVRVPPLTRRIAPHAPTLAHYINAAVFDARLWASEVIRPEPKPAPTKPGCVCESSHDSHACPVHRPTMTDLMVPPETVSPPADGGRCGACGLLHGPDDSECELMDQTCTWPNTDCSPGLHIGACPKSPPQVVPEDGRYVVEAGRCEFTCPHGDRCTLAQGHEDGHNHRTCGCNEPDLPSYLTAPTVPPMSHEVGPDTRHPVFRRSPLTTAIDEKGECGNPDCLCHT